MSISEPFSLDNNTAELFIYATIASKKENNDPIEKPIFEWIEKNKIKLPKFDLIKFIPFDPVRKRTEAIVKLNGETIIATKGAPQVIIEMSNLESTLGGS